MKKPEFSLPWEENLMIFDLSDLRCVLNLFKDHNDATTYASWWSYHVVYQFVPDFLKENMSIAFCYIFLVLCVVCNFWVPSGVL